MYYNINKAILIIVHCFNLSFVLKNTFSYMRTKVFVANWVQWHFKLSCFLSIALCNQSHFKKWNVNKNVLLPAYAICHLLGMSSACLNPILYGFMNKTFKREFKNIFSVVIDGCRSVNGCCKISESAENTLSFDVLTTGVSQMEGRTRVTCSTYV